MIFVSGTRDIRMENTAVAIGKFDSLHRGHQSLIKKINSYKSHHMTSVMFTFDYHPASMVAKKPPVLVYTSKERRILAERMGVDVLLEYPFTEETMHMEAEDFIEKILIHDLGARHVVVGEDFRFGSQRKGDARLLESMGMPLGYSAHICPEVLTVLTEDLSDHRKGEEIPISATLVRAAIVKGAMETAQEMLGSPYTVIGTVVHGREIGRSIGMPTANLVPELTKLLPPNGVYASTAIVDHRRYQAVTNVGINPTVAEGQARRVETCLYGFEGNLYGHLLEVQLLHFLRPEMRFESVDALKAQIHRDMKHALEYHSHTGDMV